MEAAWRAECTAGARPDVKDGFCLRKEEADSRFIRHRTRVDLHGPRADGTVKMFGFFRIGRSGEGQQAPGRHRTREGANPWRSRAFISRVSKRLCDISGSRAKRPDAIWETLPSAAGCNNTGGA